MRVGDYEVGRVLGQGGMGRVYAARHVRLGEDVALKELCIADPAMAQQFVLEAKLLYGLRHPCFPTVKDYFTQKGRHYLVMDLIAGTSLQELLDRESRINEAELAWVIDQLLEGVAYLHDRGIVHRDIKPGNVMVERTTRRAVLVDFGIARDGRALQTVAAARAAFTPHFAPPEQYRAEPSTPATDVYQLGATAYYAATGTLPPESITRARDQDLADPRLYAPTLPEPMARAIVRALALAPTDRYASAESMRAEWNGYSPASGSGVVTAVSPKALDTYRRLRANDIRRRP